MAVTQARAIRGRRTTGPGFQQTEALNRQLPYLNDIIRAEQQQKMRAEDVAMRKKEYNLAEAGQQQSQKLAKQQMQQQEEMQRAQFGLEGAKLGLNLATGPTGAKKLADIFPQAISGGPGGWMGGLNIANTLGAGLTGLGAGMMANKKGHKFGLGALAGGITGLIGAGAGQGLESVLSGGIMGGAGGLLSSLF